MDSIINERLEEAVTRCGELNDEMGETSAAVEAVIEGADELSQKIDSEGGDAHRALAELAARLEQVEDRLEGAGESARGRLESLAAASEESRGAVERLLATVHAELDELRARETALGEGLGEHLDGAGSAATGMGEAIGALQERLAALVAQAADEVEAFGDAVLSARQEWDTRRRALMDALDALDEAAGEETAAATQAVEALLQSQREALVDDLANEGLLGSHNRALAAAGEAVEERLPETLADAMEPLRESMASLTELCGESRTDLDERRAQMMEKVEQALAFMERLVPAYVRTGRLG